MGRRRRRPDTAPFLRFIVAAVDSRDPTIAQYVCNGVADEAEINLAFAALGAAEGVVELLEGTFTLAASIAFTANQQTLRGQGRASYIDATALGAGVHGIVLSGFTDCKIWDLAVETNAGGGNVTHGIFIEDGAHGFDVRDVTIVDSDDDGIHVEGTTINVGHIHLCHVESADGDGIHVEMDALNSMNRLHVEDNDVIGCGGNGLHLAASGGNLYCQIINNIVYNCTGDGILLTDGDYSMIRGNICLSNGADGIEVSSTDHAQIAGNLCQGNTGSGISITDASGRNMITGNTCMGNTLHGIYLVGSLNNTVTGNTCNENTQCGIQIYLNSYRNTVTGNTCNENTQYGIFLREAHSTVVVGNTVASNDSGDTDSYDGILLLDSSDNLISGNNCQLNDHHGINLDGNSNGNKIHGNLLTGNGNTDITITAATCNNNEIVWNTIEDGAVNDAGTLTRHSGNFDPSADAYIVLLGAAPF